MTDNSEENFRICLGIPGEKLSPVRPSGIDGSRRTWRLPAGIGSGYFKTQHLPSGISLTVSHVQPDTGLHARLVDDTECFTMVFSLTGRAVNKNDFFKKGFELSAGSNCLYRFPDPELVREARGGQSLGAVVITIPPEWLSNTGFFDSSVFGQRNGETGGSHGKDSFCFEKGISTPTMARVLEQIIDCRFQGPVRTFFLEAKALELVALKLDMISGTPLPVKGMTNRDMHGVLAARDLLLKDLRDPPSIRELARASGMSHPRLGKHFKSVFGCSPFEMLRMKRLEWSRELVAGNDMTLTEIAYETGYANSSHFSKAFLTHYGVQPSRYRKNKAGNPFYSMPRVTS